MSARLARPLLLAAVALSLAGGVLGGLLRAGVTVPGAASGAWIGPALLSHAALMICAFLGTVIGIERAVALRRRFAFLAPLASGLAGVGLLAGLDAAARLLLVAAALVFVAVNLVIVRRQRAAHTVLLLVAALAWLAGNLLHALREAGPATLAWWFGFLVLTIAAERLEMTRLMRRPPAAQAAFHAIVAALLLGAAASLPFPRAGGVLFGAALGALAAWLVAFDIARRTVRAGGLSRYMATCLLGGYAWLAVGGAAWAATALSWPARDAALHAIGLGFVLSMVMGHAPVILPAVARVKVQYGRPFYLPLAALHASLAIRLGPGAFDAGWRAAGSLLNAVALLAFALTVLGGILAWRLARRPRPLPNSLETN
ncbi:hypothetical protein [Caldimonas tepidiphila]|uniref:hypothetical protein n=1 Tax=Caldimonas tepidiphila TaxID=2315841 RepID=UPI000E5B92B1|nr:hypothetical protein [Caldimonas tepidiphila]